MVFIDGYPVAVETIAAVRCKRIIAIRGTGPVYLMVVAQVPNVDTRCCTCTAEVNF